MLQPGVPVDGMGGKLLQGDEENTTRLSISKTCNNLIVSEKTKRKALLILDKLKGEVFAGGRGPASVAAGIVCFASVLEAESASAKEVATKAGVSNGLSFPNVNGNEEVDKNGSPSSMMPGTGRPRDNGFSP
jgi:hypothetical protein